MGRYFGHQPRYSREEAEAQAKAALDAAVKKGRPPEEEWKALGSRMGDINRELAARPPIDLPGPPPRPATVKGDTRETGRPRAVNQILRPPAPAPEPAPPRRPRRAAEPTLPPAARAPKAAPSAPAKRATAAPAKTAKPGPGARPATGKRAAQATEPTAAAPVKRSARATEKRAPASGKRPAAKKHPE